MIEFEIHDMTCGGCAARIRRALDAAVPGATIEFDVPARRVRVSPTSGVETNQLRAVIRQAGYDARPATPRPAASAAKTGCCCAAQRATRAADSSATDSRTSGCCG